MHFCARLQRVLLPVVLHERVKVVLVGILVDVPAGPVDVGGHVPVAVERLVVHVVGLVFAATKATIHTLQRDKRSSIQLDEGQALVLMSLFTSGGELASEARPVMNYPASKTPAGREA